MAVDDFKSSNSETTMMAVKIERLPDVEENTIHSGHFMVSRVHDVNNEDDEEEVGSPFSEHSKGFDFMNANKETMTNYNFSNKAIDESMTKLFECMTLAYSGKITSPRWKQFRGLHLSQKQRIRLNNLIWREWHNQYIYRRRPMVCQFATPLSDDIHTKPEAVVLEGKYWKRRLDTVTAEYKKWRRYFKDRISQSHPVNVWENKNLCERELLDKVQEVTFIPHSATSQTANTDLNLLQAETMDIDFTSELLFSSLNQPFQFPNPREFSQLGYADLIQPGLIQLQPNLEDMMDIDPMQEFLNNKISPSTLLPDSTSILDTALQSNVSGDMTFADFFSNSNINNDINSPNSNFLGIGTAVSANPPLSQASRNAIISTSNGIIANNNSVILTDSSSVPQAINGSTLTLPMASPAGVGENSATTLCFGDMNITSMPASPGNMGGLLASQNITTASPQTLITAAQQQRQTLNSSPIAIVPNIHALNLTAAQPNKISTNTNSLLAQVIQQPLKQSPQTSPSFHLSSSSIIEQLQKQSPSVPSGSSLVTLINQGLQQIHPHHHQQQQQHQQQHHHLPQHHQQQQQQQQQQHQQQHQQQQLPVPSQTATRNTLQGRRTKSKNSIKETTPSNEVNASGMITDLAKLAQSNKKKDGLFAVPNNVPRKPRTIAPAPAPPSTSPQITAASPSSQASFLARLLKEGTYPRAVIDVKKETPVPSSLGMSDFQSNISALAQQLQATTVVTPAVMTFAPAHTQIQTTIPVVTRPPPPMIDISKLTSQELSHILSGSQHASSLGINSSPMLPVDQAVHMDQTVVVSASPVTLNSTSVLQQCSTVKRSPSPIMETSNPSSPFSLMPSSPPEGEDSQESCDSPFSPKTKKAAHLSAEQKRRSSMKTGFDKLQMLVPSLTQNPKVSKATMLQKTAEFCKKLKAERTQMQKEAAILKQEIESLNQAISNVQSQLPETGVPVSRQRKYQMKEMFEEYVRTSTIDNWKFWIFSVIMNCLYDSYCNSVSTVTWEEMCRSALTWLDQSCSLVSLRPNVLNALRKLSTSTSILTEPEKVREQALKAVTKTSKISYNIKMS